MSHNNSWEISHRGYLPPVPKGCATLGCYGRFQSFWVDGFQVGGWACLICGKVASQPLPVMKAEFMYQNAPINGPLTGQK